LESLRLGALTRPLETAILFEPEGVLEA
jgi:hypothetical protein